jgi:ribosomal protein S18 acetylase RimI-like enzyme
MSARFRVIPLSAADQGAILDVYRDCEDFLALGPQALASRAMVLADLTAAAAHGRSYCGIYVEGRDGQVEGALSELAGVIDYLLSGFAGRADTAELELLMIRAGQRGRGLGEAVVRWLEEQIRQDGRARTIESGVQVNNPRAQRFWLRMGFEIVSGPNQMEDQTVAYQLRKGLR